MARQTDESPVDAGRLSAQECVLLDKFRQACALSTRGHRVSLSVMFYAGHKACDMTIEDRERIVPRDG